jgi:hypothetical protein
LTVAALPSSSVISSPSVGWLVEDRGRADEVHAVFVLKGDVEAL